MTIPASDLDGDDLPTTLANAILHNTTAMTGLTNDVTYRAFVLARPSDEFTPEAVPLPAATGGTETVIEQGGDYYRVLTLLENGNIEVTSPGTFDLLLVGAGGPGGAATFGGMGGGSAGDVIAQPIYLEVGTYAITVGPGGISTNETTRTPGGDSVAFGLTARGGGPGASRLTAASDGGGGSYQITAGAAHPTEHSGGNGISGSTIDDRAGGGGRGSAGNGINAVDGQAGNGGPATSSDINGTATNYGRGGGGGRRGTTGAGTPNGATGQANGGPGVNPGDGGGGASSAGSTVANGGPGAAGIVILRFETTQADFEAA